MYHPKAKHIDVKHHFHRDHVGKETIAIDHIDTTNQLADIFTKTFNQDRFEFLRNHLGMRITP